uniref:Uncharacterized protein n=1 Tax=Oryza punctata TaxID=4537 RepID=A0A0E0KXX9_ORYPU
MGGVPTGGARRGDPPPPSPAMGGVPSALPPPPLRRATSPWAACGEVADPVPLWPDLILPWSVRPVPGDGARLADRRWRRVEKDDSPEPYCRLVVKSVVQVQLEKALYTEGIGGRPASGRPSAHCDVFVTAIKPLAYEIGKDSKIGKERQ